MTADLFHAQRRLEALQKEPQTAVVAAQIEEIQRAIQNLEASGYRPSASHNTGLVFAGPEYRETRKTDD